jgi:hypothetical protein
MDELVRSVYTVMMLLAYVMRRAGTFTMEEKVKMLEFIGKLSSRTYMQIQASPRDQVSNTNTFKIGHR